MKKSKDELMDIIFGPVPSRRLGRSLGINNIPPKICTFACVYCQLGNTIKMQIDRQEFFKSYDIVNAIRKKVEQILKQNDKIDYLAFVPDGEPTLDINLGKTIESLKPIGIPIAVITNASLIDKSHVRNDLAKADWVSLKIDAVTEKLWRRIERPHGKLRLEMILDGMLKFRNEFNGILATETMMIKRLNDNKNVIEEISQFLVHLNPNITYLSIPTRPPADNSIQPADNESINLAYQILSESVNRIELLTGYEGNAFSFTGDVRNDILSITAVHPMRQDAIETFLKKANARQDIIEYMLQNNELVQLKYNGKKYYLRKF